MEQYDNEERLLENQIYHIELEINGSTVEQVSFVSQYNPLFSTIRIVRSDFKTLLSTYNDQEIYEHIFSNSVLALETANPEIDETDIPYYVKQYVRYKTEYDIIFDLLITMSSKSGAQSKSLGDFSIDRTYRTPELEKILRLLENRLATWEAQLVGMKASPTGAIRAGGSEYPLTGRVF